ncbi:hypothetical protein B0H10DRAFT_2038186 [Mycena sp. CBHHK59/15]|nr:hypothetical protein B0H10DRAFT_2038186 [Mycena sp. CBHHK59/15]
MPSMMFAAGSTDRCYLCNETGNIRKCARCQVARYCSPECQKADWRHHKQTCMDHKAHLKTYAVPSLQDDVKTFMKWNDSWRDALLTWGAFAADLANRPPGYLLDHNFFICLEKQPDAAKNPARSKFQVIVAEMRSKEQMLGVFRHIPDMQYRAQIIEGFERLPPQQDVLRITVAVLSLHLYSHQGNLLDEILPDGRAEVLGNPLSAESRQLSTALQNAYSDQFAEHIRRGDVDGHSQVLESLMQAAAQDTYHTSEAASGLD